VVRHRDQPLDDLVARLVRGHVQCGIVLVVRLVEQRRLGGEERVDEVQPGALGYPMPLVAMCSAVWPFLSVRSAMLGSASSSARTTSTCPFRAAECSAVLPLLRAISARLPSTSSRSLTTSMCPCVAAVFSAVVFDESTVIDS